MSKIILALKSRTVWTGIVMWLITFAPMVDTVIPTQWKPLVDAILTLLMFYFHVTPKQTYTEPASA